MHLLKYLTLNQELFTIEMRNKLSLMKCILIKIMKVKSNLYFLYKCHFNDLRECTRTRDTEGYAFNLLLILDVAENISLKILNEK